MSIEQNLRRVLRRTPAPPGFAERVLARVEEPDCPDLRFVRQATQARRAWWLAAAAAALLMTVGSTLFLTSRRNAAEAERVRHDVNLALQITAQKLALIQVKLQ